MNLGESIRYSNRIRNKSKKAYAQAWIKYVFKGGREPSRPENLSYMAAQAVRLAIGYDH